IIIIHQELALAPQLSIAENMFLGNEVADGGVIDWYQTTARAREFMAKVGLKESPLALITNIGVGKQQLVEIAKALTLKARLLIFDEPTAALGGDETDRLFEQIARLKAEGVTFIYISHRLDEIARIADRVAVLRDGQLVA
ncbi:sugar ABC transporter ATP-binding protein, partial [Mycobacterium tuberculosis]|nr:sugar ABC transporter ATP-binding protein [Mycobacterium tuberculosis]